MNSVPRVLVFIDWFHPAYKAGGPIRSCVNFVDYLHKDIELFIFTSNSDLGSGVPLIGIVSDSWIDYKGKAKVFYASKKNRDYQSIKSAVAYVKPDYIYLNSLFSFHFSLLPLWLKWKNRTSAEVILAPRGMLRKSALAFKPFKKKVFIELFRQSGIHRRIKFQATDEQEHADIQSYFPGAEVHLMPNLPGTVETNPVALQKKKGELAVLFVGRIHPIKNLLFLLEAVEKSNGRIECSVIGAKENESYWDLCRQQIDQMPSRIKINYTGEKEHHQIMEELGRHHILALPTQGENFGHAIFEALSIGRPVLISDQTPWRSLEQKMAGWDLSLQSPEKFQQAINAAVDWDQQQFDQWSAGALRTARDFIERSSVKSSYLKLFN